MKLRMLCASKIMGLLVLIAGLLWVDAFAQIKAVQKISDTADGFTGLLDDNDDFGESVENLGDLDGDGINDIAISAEDDDDGGTNRGAVWILFLNRDGTVKAHEKLSSKTSGLSDQLRSGDQFAQDIANVGDLNNDSVR